MLKSDAFIKRELEDIARTEGSAKAAEHVAQAKLELETRKKQRKKLSHIEKAVTIAILSTLAGGFLWGLAGTIAKFLMDDYRINPLWLVCVRSFFASWLFLIVALTRQRSGLVRLLKTPIDLVKVALYALLGVFMSQLAYLMTINITNSATATLLQCLYLLILLGHSCVSFKRAPRFREVLGVAMALVGTYLISTGGNAGQVTIPFLGLIWGLITALAAALMVILPRRLIKEYGNFSVNGLAMLMVGVCFSTYFQPWNKMPSIDAVGLFWLVTIIVMGTFGAYAMYMQGLTTLGPMRVGLLGMIEPVVAMISSVLWLHINFLPGEVFGLVLILLMIWLTS